MIIFTIRTFEGTHTELGVGQPFVPSHNHDDSWFVFDRQPNEAWHLHVGPYATRADAEAWILGIREA